MTTTTASRPVKRGTRRAVLELRRLRRDYLRELHPHLKALRAAARACTRLKRAMHARADALLERGAEHPRSLDVDRHGTLAEQRDAGCDWSGHAGLEDFEQAAERYCHIAARARDSVGVAPRMPDEPDADALATDDECEDDDAAVAAEYADAPKAYFDSTEDEADDDDDDASP